MADYFRRVHSLFGIPVDALELKQAANRLEQARLRGQRCFLSTPNLNILLGARSDAALHESLLRSDLSVADGMPLVWAARLVGVPLPERVSGSSLFDWLRRHSRIPWRVFFFGGPQDVGERACAALADGPGPMRGSGYLFPGYGPVDQMSRGDWIGRINGGETDFVVVSLGAQKGQAWIMNNLAGLRPMVVSHLGAVVNFVAGTVRRAPHWMQRTGLEWLWRLKEEPRLWRRYLGDAAGLARLLATQALPLALRQWATRPGTTEFARARIEVARAGQHPQLRLHGAWREANLRPLRACLQDLEPLAAGMRIDLSDASWIDSAGAGLLLLLNAELRARGGRLVLHGAPAPLRRLLALYGLQSGDER